MQTLERATAVFCTACICAELAVRFVGGGWAQKCIKAIAGLYILVVLARMLPVAKLELRAFSIPQEAAASFGSLDGAVLAETKTALEQSLVQKWQARTGLSMKLTISVSEAAGVLKPVSADVQLPSSCTEEQLEDVRAFLKEMLELSDAQIRVARTNGEEVP